MGRRQKAQVPEERSGYLGRKLVAPGAERTELSRAVNSLHSLLAPSSPLLSVPLHSQRSIRCNTKSFRLPATRGGRPHLVFHHPPSGAPLAARHRSLDINSCRMRALGRPVLLMNTNDSAPRVS